MKLATLDPEQMSLWSVLDAPRVVAKERPKFHASLEQIKMLEQYRNRYTFNDWILACNKIAEYVERNYAKD